MSAHSTLPDIKQDISLWYNEIVYQSELADQSPVRGCIVIRPYGCQLWENIKSVLDHRIKETGHENALFPLLIPQSFLTREAQHVEGFAPELAVVTHAGGKELEEPYVVRPTSETMIHYMFARWITSWRDLPLKINQWCSVMRWEMRTRPFLRTSEFYWQEGHTAHATYQEAQEEAAMMLREYVHLAQNYLAIPVVPGRKSESEKFPGADITYTFEGLMQDGKALQMGTSHLISQNFAKAFEITFQDKEGKQAHPHLTSWGTTTRLIGAIVMMHGDQKGLIMPPKVAPIQVVIIPILKKNMDMDSVHSIINSLKKELILAGHRVIIDNDDTKTPGAKFYKWELKGVPLRIEVGPRDIEAGHVIISDRLHNQKVAIKLDAVAEYVKKGLEKFHDQLFKRAEDRIQAMWYQGEKLAEFGQQLSDQGGFYQTGWCQDPACEQELKTYKATVRCLLEDKRVHASCFVCDKPSITDILVAKAY